MAQAFFTFAFVGHIMALSEEFTYSTLLHLRYASSWYHVFCFHLLYLVKCIAELLRLLNKLDLQLCYLRAEHLQGLVLLLQFETELVCFKV